MRKTMKNVCYSLGEQGCLQHELPEKLEEMKWNLWYIFHEGYLNE